VYENISNLCLSDVTNSYLGIHSSKLSYIRHPTSDIRHPLVP
jgi:hypothetical protein